MKVLAENCINSIVGVFNDRYLRVRSEFDREKFPQSPLRHLRQDRV